MLASRLAADLVERIIRTEFDQVVATYDGYVEAQGHVKDADGAEFTDTRYAKFGRSASCEYVCMPEESGAASPRFILITVSVYYGGNEIVRAAAELGADLIIVGSHGKSDVDRLLLGSVSSFVVSNSAKNVMVVRSSQK